MTSLRPIVTTPIVVLTAIATLCVAVAYQMVREEREAQAAEDINDPSTWGCPACIHCRSPAGWVYESKALGDTGMEVIALRDSHDGTAVCDRCFIDAVYGVVEAPDVEVVEDEHGCLAMRSASVNLLIEPGAWERAVSMGARPTARRLRWLQVYADLARLRWGADGRIARVRLWARVIRMCWQQFRSRHS